MGRTGAERLGGHGVQAHAGAAGGAGGLSQGLRCLTLTYITKHKHWAAQELSAKACAVVKRLQALLVALEAEARRPSWMRAASPKVRATRLRGIFEIKSWFGMCSRHPGLGAAAAAVSQACLKGSHCCCNHPSSCEADGAPHESSSC